MSVLTFFAGDSLLDDLRGTYGPMPSTDPDLLRWYSALVASHQKLYAGLNKSEIDRELRTLSEEVKMFKVARETAADIAETRAKSSRVSSQNITALKRTLIDSNRKTMEKWSAYSPAWNAAKSAVTPDGKPDPLGAAAKLQGWTDFGGKTLSPGSEENVPAMNSLAIMLTGKNLNEVSVDQMVAALGPSAPEKVVAFVRENGGAAKIRMDNQMATQQQNLKDLEFLDQYDSKMNNLGAGSPGAEALNKKLVTIANDLEPRLMAATGRSAADIEAQRELTVNRNKEIEDSERRIKLLEARAFGTGQQTPQEKMGRLMATPQFQQWAEGNGYKLGTYRIVEGDKLVAVPGPEDAKALKKFLYQAGRPDRKYGPFMASKSTGVLVKVTAQDPEEKAKVMADYRGVGGTYYLNKDGSLVKPGEARARLESDGYIPSVETTADAKFFRLPGGAVVGQDGQPATAPADAKFFPALKADNTGTPVGYVTPNDVSSADKIKAIRIGLDDGSLEEKDKAALRSLAQNAPYQVADENTVKSSWTGTYTGYLDKPHANDAIVSQTGLSNISLDGGRVIIPGGRPATIEILEAKEPGLVAGVVRAFHKAMPEKHIEDLRREGLVKELPTEEAVRLGEEQLRAYEKGQELPPAPPTDVVTTVTAPSGIQQEVVLPIGSQAADTAQRELRTVIPVGGGTATAPAATTTPSAAAPATTTAPAAKPAPTAAPSAAKTMRDDKGNVFEVTDDKIKFVSAGEGQKIPTKKEWDKSSSTGQAIMGVLNTEAAKSAAPAAEAKPASVVPTAAAGTKVTVPVKEGPEVSARGTAAVVGPRPGPGKEKELSDEEMVDALAAKRKAEQAAKAKVKAVPVEKPVEKGERLPEQEQVMVQDAAQKARDEADIRKGAARLGMPELVKRMEALRTMRSASPLAYEKMIREGKVAGIEEMAEDVRRGRRPKAFTQPTMVNPTESSGPLPERIEQNAQGELEVKPAGSFSVAQTAAFDQPQAAPPAQKLSRWKQLFGKREPQPTQAPE